MPARLLLWFLAMFVAILSARYFLSPVPLLKPPDHVIEMYEPGPLRDGAINIAPYLLENHRGLFLGHIGFGIAAMVIGLLQFIAKLRNAKPQIHRKLGYVYFAAIWVGSITAFPLAFLMLRAVAPAVRPQMMLVTVSFVFLSITWAAVTTMAVLRAKHGRFDEHRAWMIRSYSLTFAAVTTRLVSIPLLFLTGGDIFLTVTGSLWSWPLNLVVAEWLIRRKRAPVRTPSPALAS